MALLLVLHDLGTPAAEAEEDFLCTFFGLAPEHWRVAPGATLAGTDLSPGYLLRQLRESARRCGIAPRLLMVLPVPEGMVAHGLTEEGAAWLRSMQD